MCVRNAGEVYLCKVDVIQKAFTLVHSGPVRVSTFLIHFIRTERRAHNHIVIVCMRYIMRSMKLWAN